MCFMKGVVRTGLIVALAGGGSALVAETVRPGSVGAIVGQARGAIATQIDHAVNESSALRAQLAKLEAEYPQRIAEVRSDLTDVHEQVAQLDRDLAVSDKVVQLTSADLAMLDSGIAQARAASEATPYAVVRIAFDNRKMDLQNAYGRRAQIEQTQKAYSNRGEEIATELTFLRDQEAQLAELLGQLESEHAQFQAQILQLDAQIDAIDRNDRLIAMMEDRQARIDELSRYETHSLDQYQRKVSRIRAEQGERLASLGTRQQTMDYEDVAKYELDQSGDLPTIRPTFTPAAPQEIIVDPTAASDDGQVATID